MFCLHTKVAKTCEQCGIIHVHSYSNDVCFCHKNRKIALVDFLNHLKLDVNELPSRNRTVMARKSDSRRM
jgi:hypothetical protein